MEDKEICIAMEDLSEKISPILSAFSLTSVSTVTLNHCKLSSFPLSFPNLELLSLSNNVFSEFSDIAPQPRLLKLMLDFNELTSIDLNHFPLCEFLSVSYNKIRSFEKSCHFSTLRHLNIAANQLSSLSDISNVFPAVETLNLSGNDLRDLCQLESLELMPKLSNLSMTSSFYGSNPIALRVPLLAFLQPKLPNLLIFNDQSLSENTRSESDEQRSRFYSDKLAKSGINLRFISEKLFSSKLQEFKNDLETPSNRRFEVLSELSRSEELVHFQNKIIALEQSSRGVIKVRRSNPASLQELSVIQESSLVKSGQVSVICGLNVTASVELLDISYQISASEVFLLPPKDLTLDQYLEALIREPQAQPLVFTNSADLALNWGPELWLFDLSLLSKPQISVDITFDLNSDDLQKETETFADELQKRMKASGEKTISAKISEASFICLTSERFRFRLKHLIFATKNTDLVKTISDRNSLDEFDLFELPLMKKICEIFSMVFSEFEIDHLIEKSETEFRNVNCCLKEIMFHEPMENLEILDLRHNLLTDLPDLRNVKNIKTLDLSFNLLAHHSSFKYLGYLSKLENFSIDSNPICLSMNPDAIFSIVQKCIKTTVKMAASGLIKQIDPASKSTSLADLILSKLPPTKKITMLNLDRCGLKIVPFSIFSLPFLTSLSLEGNNISKLPFLPPGNYPLTYLNLSMNGFNSLTSLSPLASLTLLSVFVFEYNLVCSSKLKGFLISLLPSLSFLSYSPVTASEVSNSNQMFKSVISAANITGFIKKGTLCMANAGMKSIEEILLPGEYLSSVVKIDLRQNNFSSLDFFSSNLSNVVVLDASFNKLTSLFPKKSAQINFESLESLDLSHNSLPTLSDISAEPLLACANLNISYNCLVSLDFLSLFPRLKTLSASNNRLECFPKVSLPFLKLVNLDNNRIKNLKNIEKLIGVVYLSLKSNKISDFDQVSLLGQLELLRGLEVEGNPIAMKRGHRSYISETLRGLAYLDRKVLREEGYMT